MHFILKKQPDGRYCLIPEDPNAGPADFPDYWASSPMEFLGKTDTRDPDHPDVIKTEPRLYGVIKFAGHYYHVWFFVKARGGGSGHPDTHLLRCVARAISYGKGNSPYEGGYNNGRD